MLPLCPAMMREIVLARELDHKRRMMAMEPDLMPDEPPEPVVRQSRTSRLMRLLGESMRISTARAASPSKPEGVSPGCAITAVAQGPVPCDRAQPDKKPGQRPIWGPSVPPTSGHGGFPSSRWRWAAPLSRIRDRRAQVPALRPTGDGGGKPDTVRKSTANASPDEIRAAYPTSESNVASYGWPVHRRRMKDHGPRLTW